MATELSNKLKILNFYLKTIYDFDGDALSKLPANN
jgi:hypothetical protein